MKSLGLILFILSIIVGAPFSHAGEVIGKVTASGNDNLENVLVYIEAVPGNFPPPKKQPEINHINLRFEPNVLAVVKGTTIAFPNADKVFHSAFSISKSNPFELGIYGPGREKSWTFQNLGLTEIFCHIHSHMFGFVMVLDNPFFSSTSKDGSFSFTDVPDGIYKIKAWMSPNLQETKSVTIKKGEPVTVNFVLKAER